MAKTKTDIDTQPSTDIDTLTDAASDNPSSSTVEPTESTPPAPNPLRDYRVLSRLIHSGVTYEADQTVSLTPEKAQKLLDLGVVADA